MAKFPLEPSYTKVLLAGHYISNKCGVTCCKMLALLSTESIWFSVSRLDQEKQDKLKATRDQFQDFTSDHQSLVNIYDFWLNKMYD